MIAYAFQAEIWYLDQFEYAELNGDVHFFRFPLEKPFLGKFGHKLQNYYFKVARVINLKLVFTD